MKDRPNLLFVLVDSQRSDTLAANGNHKIRVPNLNKLAEESAVFHRAYCSSPVCKPARSSILTGMYPQNSGVLSNRQNLSEDQPILIDHIQKEEYKTGYMGLWSVSGEIKPRPGFDEWVSTLDGFSQGDDGSYTVAHSDYTRFLLESGFEMDEVKKGHPSFSKIFCKKKVDEAHTKPAFLTEKATDFIRRNRDDSFILFVSFKEPHPPYLSPFDNMYDPAEVSLPATFDIEPGEDIPLKYRLNRLHYQKESPSHGEPLCDEAAWRRLVARYWGQVSLVDKYTGVLLNCLEECGLERDTIVVFTSDHGEIVGEFGILGKCMMLEGAVRVPLLIKIPGITDGQVPIEPPVGTVDLLATLMDIMNMPPPARLDGKSLFPLIRGEQPQQQRDVFIQWNGSVGEQGFMPEHREGPFKEQVDRVYGADIATIITADGWKLSLSTADEHELYNLHDDPDETKNLYFDGAHGETIERLSQRIDKWRQQ